MEEKIMTGLICRYCKHENYYAIAGDRCDQCDNVLEGTDDPGQPDPEN